jgi:hypothetical protein
MSPIASRPSANVARFVAYDRNPMRVGNPEDGTAITVRAETFVEEYASIAIKKSVAKSTGDGFDTVDVKFDVLSGAQGAGMPRVSARRGRSANGMVPSFARRAFGMVISIPPSLSRSTEECVRVRANNAGRIRYCTLATSLRSVRRLELAPPLPSRSNVVGYATARP